MVGSKFLYPHLMKESSSKNQFCRIVQGRYTNRVICSQRIIVTFFLEGVLYIDTKDTERENVLSV
jgi:hypothetical protein